MKLHEKIYYCRKKSGLSQDALAEKLGISRQAISKWETGESVPETGKLVALASALGVTVDWLLSEDEPEAESEPAGDDGGVFTGAKRDYSRPADWTDSLPRLIQNLARRWGWLAGVYVALCGVAFVIFGVLASVISNNMFSGFNDFGMGFGGFGTTVEIDGVTVPIQGGMVQNNPVAIMGTVITIIGVVLIIAGIVLAVFLKKKSKE